MFNLMIRNTLPVLVVGLLSLPVQADIGSDLRSAFQGMSMSNTTGAGAYRGQTATMLTGGGYTERTPVRSYQLYSLQMPRIRAGCGGIDVFAGGFSYINSDQFTAMISNLASNAKGVAYQLAINVVSAQLSDVLKEAKALAEKYNSFQINSCQDATALVNGAYDFMAGREVGCIQEQVRQGKDWGEARVSCGAGGSTDQPQDEGTRNAAPFVGNLAWMAMSKSNLFNSDATNDYTLRYLSMALTGTIIRIPETAAEPARTITWPSALWDGRGRESLESFIYGGNLYVYECKDSTGQEWCRDIEPDYMEISEANSLFTQAKTRLQGLLDKIPTDTPLTAQEEVFLDSTRLPVWTLLAAAYAAGGPTLAQTHLDELAEIMARDLLYRYLEDLIGSVQQQLSNVTAADTDTLRDFSNSIARVRNYLAQVEERNLDRVNQLASVYERHDAYRRILISRMPGNTFVPAALMGSGE